MKENNNKLIGEILMNNYKESLKLKNEISKQQDMIGIFFHQKRLLSNIKKFGKECI
jgi:hypothetical protein